MTPTGPGAPGADAAGLTPERPFLALALLRNLRVARSVIVVVILLGLVLPHVHPRTPDARVPRDVLQGLGHGSGQGPDDGGRHRHPRRAAATRGKPGSTRRRSALPRRRSRPPAAAPRTVPPPRTAR